MARCILNIEAEDINDLFATLRRGAEHLTGTTPVTRAAETGSSRDEGLAAALDAGETMQAEPAKQRTRRTKAEMEEAKADAPAEEVVEEAKTNGEAAELTINDVREAINEALRRRGGKADELKEAIRSTFNVKVPSEIPPARFPEAIEFLQAF